MSNKRLTNSLQLLTAGQVIPRIGPLHHLISGSMASKLKTCNVAIFKIFVGMTMFYMFALGNHIDPLPTLCFGNPKQRGNQCKPHSLLFNLFKVKLNCKPREGNAEDCHLRPHSIYMKKKKQQFWASDKAKFELMMLGHYCLIQSDHRNTNMLSLSQTWALF